MWHALNTVTADLKAIKYSNTFVLRFCTAHGSSKTDGQNMWNSSGPNTNAEDACIW